MKTYPNRHEMVLDIIKPGSRIAELGVLTGMFSNILLQTSPSKLYLVDNWQYKMSDFVNGQTIWQYPEASLLQVFQRFSAQIKSRNVEIHIRNVLDFLDNAPPLDYIYLDDTHEYVHLKTEIRSCQAPFIFVHDYCEVFPQVKKAVDESIQELDLEIIGITDEQKMPVFPKEDWMTDTVAYNTICLMRQGTF
jgi:hypothetical protein